MKPTCKVCELVYRAIENVVRNALRYTGHGTEVNVDAQLADISGRKSTFKDHGPGVPHSEVARIFEPFQRRIDTAKVAGHGLGLAIAKQSFDIQGGSIRAENREGSGLKIEIHIPELF